MMTKQTIRILLIEDNKAEALLLQEMLSEDPHESYEVEQTSRLASALSLLEQRTFDVILLDLLLPDSKGLTTFTHLHRQAPSDLPIIVLSGLADEELAVEAVRQGAQDYLAKGRVDKNTLTRSIRYAMERKQIEEALRRRTEELKVRNEELDAFVHSVAHDLRTPLSLILGFAELIEEDYKTITPLELLENVQLILQYGRKMSTIIDELLLLSNVRHAEVNLYELDMEEVVSSVLERLKHLIQEKEAQVHRPTTWPRALGYAPWIEEVWFNYLHNALQYGGPAPRIELGAEKTANGRVRFWVRDEGPGIPPEKRDDLFIPFTRLTQAKTEGHGLGLSIVKRIVVKLGGEVDVESEVGRGSTFSFELQSSHP
ncbi:MAG: sensor histidine kinase [Anaerolineae bacterium]